MISCVLHIIPLLQVPGAPRSHCCGALQPLMVTLHSRPCLLQQRQQQQQQLKPWQMQAAAAPHWLQLHRTAQLVAAAVVASVASSAGVAVRLTCRTVGLRLRLALLQAPPAAQAMVLQKPRQQQMAPVNMCLRGLLGVAGAVDEAGAGAVLLSVQGRQMQQQVVTQLLQLTPATARVYRRLRTLRTQAWMLQAAAAGAVGAAEAGAGAPVHAHPLVGNSRRWWQQQQQLQEAVLVQLRALLKRQRLQAQQQQQLTEWMVVRLVVGGAGAVVGGAAGLAGALRLLQQVVVGGVPVLSQCVLCGGPRGHPQVQTLQDRAAAAAAQGLQPLLPATWQLRLLLRLLVLLLQPQQQQRQRQMMVCQEQAGFPRGVQGATGAATPLRLQL